MTNSVNKFLLIIWLINFLAFVVVQNGNKIFSANAANESSSSSSSSNSSSSTFSRFLTNLFGAGPRQRHNRTSKADKWRMEHTNNIAKLENAIRDQKHMAPLTKCQSIIQIAIYKFLLSIDEKMEHHKAINELIADPSAVDKPKYYEENEQLLNDQEAVMLEIKRLDAQIFVYRRAMCTLNAACELHVDSNEFDLREPLYSNAFIKFVAEGAGYCTMVKLGKSVDYPDVQAKHRYNFFEELIEEIVDTENAAKVVRKMEFSLNKAEQQKDYHAILGPAGVLRHSGVLLRQGQIGTEGIIEILGEQNFVKKNILKTQKMREQFYKVSNKKTKAAFEVRLVFSKSRKRTTKLVALRINAMPSP